MTPDSDLRLGKLWNKIKHDFWAHLLGITRQSTKDKYFQRTTFILLLLVLVLECKLLSSSGYLPLSWGARDRMRASYNVTNLSLLWRTQLFFLNTCSLSCHKYLVNFQGSEKVYSDHFWEIFSCFYGGVHFWSTLLYHLHRDHNSPFFYPLYPENHQSQPVVPLKITFICFS